MVEYTNPQSFRSNWLWPILIALLGGLAAFVLVNPSGDRDGQVEDPIVIEDLGAGAGVDQNSAESGDAVPAPEPLAPGGQPEG